MWDVVAIVVLVVCCLLAVVMTAVRLPGTWLIVVAAIVYGWWADWRPVGLILVAVLVGLGLVGEGVELLASVFTAKRAGATRQAAWGGLLGGLLGMFFLSFLVPVPLVGTMIGALLGCFAGATLAELWMRKEVTQGAKVGFFSAVGFALGAAAKIAIALVMSGILLTSAVCSKPHPIDDALEASRASPARDLLVQDHTDASGTRLAAFVLDLDELALL